MKLFRSGWDGLGLLFLGMGSLAACVMQGSQSESEAVRQNELVDTAGGGPVLELCPAPSTVYPMNRVRGDWDVGCPCTTTLGVPAHLQSKCAVTPSTCGYLYCVNPVESCPDPAPTYTASGGAGTTLPDYVEWSNAHIGCACVTVSGLPGHLISECSTRPTTCSLLRCVGDHW